MASKKYAYYNKGNKIGLIQKKTTDVSSSEYGKYKSPIDTVSDGLEVEYSYAPTYRVQGAPDDVGVNYTQFLGWGSNGTNLVLYAYGASDFRDLTDAGFGGLATDDWIYITNGLWTGLHKVINPGASNNLGDVLDEFPLAQGMLTLDTRFNIPAPYMNLATGDFSTTLSSHEFTAGNSAIKRRLVNFKDEWSHLPSNYVFIRQAVDAVNNGLFEVDLSTDDKVNFLNKITMNATTNEHVITGFPSIGAAETGDQCYMYQVFYESAGINVRSQVEVMQDESFELDLTRYQSNAVVYYLQAKKFEDAGDIEGHEYYMRKFKNQLEKASGARKHGPNIAQGHWNMLR